MSIKPKTDPRTRAIRAHNALSGAVGFSDGCMKRVIQSKTTTPRAKELASACRRIFGELRYEIKNRVDKELP